MVLAEEERRRLVRGALRFLERHFVSADEAEGAAGADGAAGIDGAAGAAAMAAFGPIMGAALCVGSMRSLQGRHVSDAARQAMLEGLQQMFRPGFTEALLELCQQSGLANAELYRRAGLTKAHFSKIKNDPEYHPSKETVLAFALAFKLTVEQTQQFLARAGYTLSRSIREDCIIEYLIRQHIYDIDEVNIILDECGFQPLTNKRGR